MPVYKVSINGEELPRLIRADTAAKARDHLVKTESVSADELADLLDKGATIEKATAAPATEEKEPEAKGATGTTEPGTGEAKV